MQASRQPLIFRSTAHPQKQNELTHALYILFDPASITTLSKIGFKERKDIFLRQRGKLIQNLRNLSICFYKQLINQPICQQILPSMELAHCRRITVGLPRKEDNMFMQDFIQRSVLSRVTLGAIKTRTPYDERVESMIHDKIKHIQQNPEEYFNFGFNLDDFKQYLIKITYSRANRILVDEHRLVAAHNYTEHMKITPEDYSSLHPNFNKS